MTTITAGTTVVVDAGFRTRIAPINIAGELNIAGEINLSNGAAAGSGDGAGLATADPTRTDAAAGSGDGFVADYADFRVRLGTSETIAAGTAQTVGAIHAGGEVNLAGELNTFREQTATPTRTDAAAGSGDSLATGIETLTVRPPVSRSLRAGASETIAAGTTAVGDPTNIGGEVNLAGELDTLSGGDGAATGVTIPAAIATGIGAATGGTTNVRTRTDAALGLGDASGDAFAGQTAIGSGDGAGVVTATPTRTDAAAGSGDGLGTLTDFVLLQPFTRTDSFAVEYDETVNTNLNVK